jgi:hypothetical protein
VGSLRAGHEIRSPERTLLRPACGEAWEALSSASGGVRAVRDDDSQKAL